MRLPAPLFAGRKLLFGGALALAASQVLGGAMPASAGSNHTHSLVKAIYAGHSRFSSGHGAVPNGLQQDAVAPQAPGDAQFPKSGNGPSRLPANAVPQPQPNGLSGSNAGVTNSWAGLDHFDSRTAGSGDYVNTNYSLEPPDQGLCVGSGFVIEAVNDALQVYSTSGTALTAPENLNQFYNLSPAIIRSTDPVTRGAELGDPRCYYDAATNSWFVTVYNAPQDPSGNLIAPTSVAIAVDTGGHPDTDTWSLYELPTTDDGTAGMPSDTGCPCFPDQPLIGADANGFYVSTNEYTLAGNGFNGTQLYAFSKSGLESGSDTTAVHINVGALPTPDTGGIWYSVQPATTPPGGSFATDTEYFLSALQFFAKPASDNRIAVWALTGTDTLGDANPTVTLSDEVIGSEVYSAPPSVSQRPGSTPLAAVIQSIYAPKRGNNPPQPEDIVSGNDDRMNQVVYAGGKLWSAVNTAVASNGYTREGIAYFLVSPSVTDNQVSGSMSSQGYVDLAQTSVMYPSIGVNSSGQGVMSFSVVGPNTYPSAGYAYIDPDTGASAVHIAAAGAGPDDGFTGYYPFALTPRLARWGDYSAAVADESGNIWLASEYIGQTCTLGVFLNDPTCGGTRTILANWGTFITEIAP